MSVNWSLAECKDSDLDWTATNNTNVTACLSLCGACQIRVQCRDHADRTKETVLIMGGEDPAARKARWHLEAKKGTS